MANALNKHKTKTRLIDGRGASKSFSLDGMTAEQWNQLFPKNQFDGNTITTRDAYQSISWVNRGVTLRASGVASMPFSILRNGTVVDGSKDYKNIVKFMPEPVRLFELIEASLTLLGRAYLFRISNMIGTQTQALRYMAPTTITPVINEIMGLVGYKRELAGGMREFMPEQIINFWAGDPYIEIGPPEASPVKSALGAAGVLMNVDEFAAKYFERGAIKATLLTVQGNPLDAEKDKLKSWWGRMMTGVANSWGNAVISADGVTPVIIGEGLESLNNNDLAKEKREDIATGIGIPHSLLFSSAANYSVAEQDNRQFYETTIIPEALFIASVLNAQVFKPAGFMLRFDDQSLSIFQEDEKDRSAAYLNYVNAGMPPGTAAEVLGLKLPEGMGYDYLDQAIAEVREARLAAVAEQRAAPTAAGNVTEDKARVDLDKWHRRTINRFEAGKLLNGKPFESDHINKTLNAAIVGSLQTAGTTGAIDRIFYDALTWRQYP